MITRRRAIAVATAICWTGATTGMLYDWPPGEKTHSTLLAAGLVCFIWLRTSPRQDNRTTRRTATLLYEMGVHAEKCRTQEVGQVEPQAGPAVSDLSQHRRARRLGGGGAASITAFAGVICLLIVIGSGVADSVERATVSESPPRHSPPAVQFADEPGRSADASNSAQQHLKGAAAPAPDRDQGQRPNTRSGQPSNGGRSTAPPTESPSSEPAVAGEDGDEPLVATPPEVDVPTADPTVAAQ